MEEKPELYLQDLVPGVCFASEGRTCYCLCYKELAGKSDDEIIILKNVTNPFQRIDKSDQWLHCNSQEYHRQFIETTLKPEDISLLRTTR